MAIATLITSMHYQPHLSSSSGYPHPASGTSIANMISAVETRKPADNNEPSNRQSLPSISEIISAAKPGPYPPIPFSSLQPNSNSSLLSPFAPASLLYPEAEKHSPPYILHPTLSFPPRQDALLVLDSPRPSFGSRASLLTASDRRPSPSLQPGVPPHLLTGVYARPPPSPSAPMSYQPGQLPPDLMLLPVYPISPRHAVPPLVPGPYDPRQAPHAKETVYWSYKELLSRIGFLSRTIFNFAEAYSTIAQA
ncbi:hypothetical protein BKA56DRAFT_707140 [Ilyonectria sp. MPI-CAGE-AT-0026]|nr:hypothetical protein BKA56DRAFT_707140 [Ilyonectria sp. MPI-CAGE-AT-0026]